MRFNGKPTTDGQVLTQLVAADGASGGFIKDSDVSAFIRTVLDDADGRAAAATLGTWRVLAASAAAVSHTGNTNETTLATVTIPAAAMGTNGVLRITTLWSHTNSGNNKTLRIRPGSGNRLLVANVTTSASTRDQRMFSNRNSASSQVSGGNGGLSTGNWGATADTIVTNTIDTTAAFDFTFTGQLASGTETVTLESYMVELFYAA